MIITDNDLMSSMPVRRTSRENAFRRPYPAFQTIILRAW